ncbi:MAG TPA: alanine--glyoxylate aminotransferase family protein [Thermoleophilia bacterium]|nr:alanine--glyoxylate aminotransferase family protein [Thermoleophilia bacterium]
MPEDLRKLTADELDRLALEETEMLLRADYPVPGMKFTLGAGPVTVHERVSLALARAPLDHEDPDFQEIFHSTTDKLKRVFRTAQDTIIMQGEAVLGLEAAAANLVEPGDKCLNLVSGPYGAGYRRYFDHYGGEVVEVNAPYDEAIDPDEVEAVLRREGDVKVIALVHSETPSGTVNPLAEIASLARRYGALTVVDAVSSLGSTPVEFDAWGLDIAVAAPHKCLGGLPGSALLAVSERAWAKIRSRPDPPRRRYISLLDWKDGWLDEGHFPFTPFVAQIVGLEEALTARLEEGLENAFARHDFCARMCRAGVRGLGLELWPKHEEEMCNCVTAVKLPAGLSEDDIRLTMNRRYGVVIAGGLRELHGKLLRIGHMGHIAQPMYVIVALSALERTLHDNGFALRFGDGVGAALAAMDGPA